MPQLMNNVLSIAYPGGSLPAAVIGSQLNAFGHSVIERIARSHIDIYKSLTPTEADVLRR